MNKIKKFEEYQITESVHYDVLEDDIRTLFHRYDQQLPKEKVGVRGLRKSLELVGNGEITEKSHYDYPGDRLMYKEMLMDNKLIIVIHARLKSSPYEYTDRGYSYEIGLYRNDPRSYQIGGGYGASGIVGIEHTRLIAYDDYDKVHYNKEILSKVIEYVKKKVTDENNTDSISDKEYKIGDKVFTKMWAKHSNGTYRRNGEIVDIKDGKYSVKMNDDKRTIELTKDYLT